MRIALMVPDFNPDGDAVGNDVLGMYEALAARCLDVRIYVGTPRTGTSMRTFSYTELAAWLRRGDTIIYHYATADDDGLKILERTSAKVILRYHNVTPPHFFSGYSDEYEEATRRGQEDVRRLSNLRWLSLMPASLFSGHDLRRSGLDGRAVHIVPPYHRAEELLALSNAHSWPERAEPHFNLLSVGRIAPHKGLHRLVECIGAVRRRIGWAITLTIVGTADARLASYSRELDEAIGASQMRDSVRFEPHASPAALGACYRRADLVVTCSEHEGFWVPGVEAMAFGKPIVALRRAALIETCREAAELCDTEVAMAQVIEDLLANPSGRAALGRRARSRYDEEFAPAQIDGKFFAVLNPSVGSLWRRLLHGLVKRRDRPLDA